MPSYITTSRYWDNPQILSRLTVEGIAIGMEVNDFIKALKAEMQLTDDRMDKACDRVIKKMKEESGKVIGLAGKKNK
jgi:hypothetical protein